MASGASKPLEALQMAADSDAEAIIFVSHGKLDQAEYKLLKKIADSSKTLYLFGTSPDKRWQRLKSELKR